MQSVDRVLSILQSRLDGHAILAGNAIDARYCDDATGRSGDRPLLVFRPRSTGDVSEIIAVCNESRLPLVIQGGRTGLSGGARVRQGEAVLSLERMTGIEPIDPVAGVILVDAGTPLQLVQQAADDAGFFFGVDIGARGTATIGGNIATNAGGIRVLRYGSFRSQVLGVEAVMSDGMVLSSLKGLAKDNSGCDLSQLLIASEGTLGVITRACLKLQAKPVTQCAAFCSLPSLAAAFELLRRLRSRVGTILAGFELILEPLMSDMAKRLQLTPPIALSAPVYVLTDIHGGSPSVDEELFASELEKAIEDGVVSDAALSQSLREYLALWTLRDDCSRFLEVTGPKLSFDVSIPLSRMAEFLDLAGSAQRSVDPSARAYIFGHLGDGNLHYLVTTDKEPEVTNAVLVSVRNVGGSISAEHGIGLDKKPYLYLARSPAEISAMRRLKAAFDPNGILNPGRIFDMP